MITHGSPTEALNQTLLLAFWQIQFWGIHRNILPPTPRRLVRERAFLLFSTLFFTRPHPPRPLFRFPVISSLVMAQRRDEISPLPPPFHLPEHTCKVFTRIYGRFSIHNRGVPRVENKASSIVATHVSVPINRCPAHLTRSSFFLSSPFWRAYSLVSYFLFSTPWLEISLWFPGRSTFLFDLSVFSFFIFFPLADSLGRGMERERRGDITVGFSHGKRLAESPLC